MKLAGGLEILWKIPETLPPLEIDEVHVWAVILDDSPLARPNQDSILSPDEVERANRFHFSRDQLRFRRCRTMLRTILARYLRADPGTLVFEYGSHGKPVIGASVPGPLLHFNLSHSDSLALVAVTSACPVGIDLERLRSIDNLQDMADRFFSQAESVALKGAPEGQRVEAFFDLWTRKEAVIKATGKGMTDVGVQFDCLSIEERTNGRVDIQVKRVLLAGWTLDRFEPAKGFRAALATPVETLRVVTRLWSEG